MLPGATRTLPSRMRAHSPPIAFLPGRMLLLASPILSPARAIGSLADPILLCTGRIVCRTVEIVSQAGPMLLLASAILSPATAIGSLADPIVNPPKNAVQWAARILQAARLESLEKYFLCVLAPKDSPDLEPLCR